MRWPEKRIKTILDDTVHTFITFPNMSEPRIGNYYKVISPEV